jgi:hypothetical protein
MMSKIPVAGVVWQTVQYLLGFQRLGYDVYYVEAHARTPSMLMQSEDDDSSALAAAFIERVMRRFDLGDKWAFHALHDDHRCFGMSELALNEVYRSAGLIINLHGGTIPLPEHCATGRLIYLETDPVDIQVEVFQNCRQTIDFLALHSAFFSFGENFGGPGCRVPQSDRFHFRPTRQPVLVDFWLPCANGPGSVWTTIGNWKQPQRQVRLNGEVYHWSKHYEFLRFLELPHRAGQEFELALGNCGESDRQMLNEKGWRVRGAADLSNDIDVYREYIVRSRGEFTVAKDQNIRLASGWFSDRSATYLAAGRPVITQETGFSNILPTGRGLFGFSTLEDILGALENINSDYTGHCRAAAGLAREYFNYDVVLPKLLGEVGL